jgi:hypothetical protein
VKTKPHKAKAAQAFYNRTVLRDKPPGGKYIPSWKRAGFDEKKVEKL